MIYASHHATGPQPGITLVHNPALERQPSPQSQVNTEFAQITSQLDPVPAPERLSRPDEVVYAVGYSAVNDSVAVGAARLPGEFYMSGQAPEKSLEQVAQAHMGQIHPGAMWHSVEQQRLAREAFPGSDPDDEEEDEEGRPRSRRKELISV